MIDFAHTLQPDIIINDRTGAKGDFDTPEQRVGGFQINRPWETCMTIANQWAWKPNDEVKSLEQCIQSLVRSAGGDGNLLFNVGPKPDGSKLDLKLPKTTAQKVRLLMKEFSQTHGIYEIVLL